MAWSGVNPAKPASTLDAVATPPFVAAATLVSVTVGCTLTRSVSVTGAAPSTTKVTGTAYSPTRSARIDTVTCGTLPRGMVTAVLAGRAVSPSGTATEREPSTLPARSLASPTATA